MPGCIKNRILGVVLAALSFAMLPSSGHAACGALTTADITGASITFLGDNYVQCWVNGNQISFGGPIEVNGVTTTLQGPFPVSPAFFVNFPAINVIGFQIEDTAINAPGNFAGVSYDLAITYAGCPTQHVISNGSCVKTRQSGTRAARAPQAGWDINTFVEDGTWFTPFSNNPCFCDAGCVFVAGDACPGANWGVVPGVNNWISQQSGFLDASNKGSQDYRQLFQLGVAGCPPPTPTPLPTLSFTKTATITKTRTPTPTKTWTPTTTISRTPSPTPSHTPTPTWTRTATPTPSFTESATPSPTLTPTRTFTATSTPSPTSSRTPTPTWTPTATQTITYTASASPTPTFTISFTPTGTRTATPTSSRTATPTWTPTATQTITFTASSSPTPTPTSTVTFTGTPTVTPTQSRTATPTWTPTATASITFTVSASPTPTLTQTATSTWTPTATSSASRTVTPTWTPTATQTITFTTSTSPTPTPSQTATRTWTQSVTPTNSSTATPSITRTATPSPTPTLTQTPTLSFTESPMASDTVSPSASASPTPSGTLTQSPTETLSFTLTNSPVDTATLTSTTSPSVTLTPSPSPSDSPTPTLTFTDSPIASDTVSPTVTPTVTLTSSPVDTPTSSVTLTPSPTPSDTPTATLTSTDSPIASDTASPTSSFTLTISPTPSDTLTFTPTSTNSPAISDTDSPTQSATLTESPTPTDSPTQTATLTPTLSFSASPSRSASPTGSPTPVPQPFQITVKVYNSAGEEVALLYKGGVTQMPGSPTLKGGLVQSGYQGVDLQFAGILDSGSPILSWNGGDDTGGHVSGGVYYIHVESTDQFGSVSAYNLGVNVVDPKPVNEINIFNSAGEMVYHESFASLTVTVTDLALDQVAFAPAAGKLTGQLRNGQGTLSSWSWDGKGSDGHLLSAGVYTIQLLNQVPGGGSKAVLRQVQILAAPDSTDSKALVVSSAKGLLIRFDPAAVAGGLRARVYNMAGELIGSAGISSAAGAMSFDASSLASGIYVIVFEYQTPSGTRKRTLIKAALLK